ncbi:MAG: hypothetical protein R2812_02980 [Gelidibacter sp.]
MPLIFVEKVVPYMSNIIGVPGDTQVACLYTIPNPSWNIIQIGDPGSYQYSNGSKHRVRC